MDRKSEERLLYGRGEHLVRVEWMNDEFGYGGSNSSCGVFEGRVFHV